MDKPKIDELGTDLLKASTLDFVLILVRPLILIILFFLVYETEFYWLLPMVVFALFVTVINFTHDLVHNSLGLPPRLNELLISLSGMLILESGHSYKVTHHLHHRNFPNKTDPEGEPAKNGFVKSLLIGPFYIPKLFIWAYSYSLKKKDFRMIRWMRLEALFFGMFLLIGVLLLPETKAVLTYGLMVVVGGWFYPMITVYMPHRKYNGKELGNTIRYKGKLTSYLFINQIFHLEHHLYPHVPTCNLKKLSERLSPYLDKNRSELVERVLL